MYKNPEDIKQLIVLLVLAITMVVFVLMRQFDYADNIITAFIAIMANNNIVKSKDK